MRTWLAVALLVGACDLDAAESERSWDTPTLAEVRGGPEVAPESLDWSDVLRPPPPPPAVRVCVAGFVEFACTPSWALCCERQPGTSWPADPCAPLALATRTGDLIACE